MLAAAALTGLAPRRARAEAESRLLVAGPPGSRLDQWAVPLASVLGRAMPSQAPLAHRNLGGLDGVTAANAFEARTEPDGSTALLVPGAATLSWMVGEHRAKFDPARWLPLWAAIGPAVLVSRARLDGGGVAKVGAAGPVGPELPALLALDLLGVAVGLVPGTEADTLLLTGPDLPLALARAAREEMRPVFTLAPLDGDGEWARDPFLPTVPTAAELVRDRAPAGLFAALRAASLAVQLDANLVLPLMTPAAAVASWRRACQLNIGSPELLDTAQGQGSRMIPPDRAASWLGRIAGDPGLLLALRRWLSVRHGWVPA